MTALVNRCTPVLTPLPDDVVGWFEQLLDVPVRVTGTGADRCEYRVPVPLPC